MEVLIGAIIDGRLQVCQPCLRPCEAFLALPGGAIPSPSGSDQVESGSHCLSPREKPRFRPRGHDLTIYSPGTSRA